MEVTPSTMRSFIAGKVTDEERSAVLEELDKPGSYANKYLDAVRRRAMRVFDINWGGLIDWNEQTYDTEK